MVTIMNDKLFWEICEQLKLIPPITTEDPRRVILQNVRSPVYRQVNSQVQFRIEYKAREFYKWNR